MKAFGPSLAALYSLDGGRLQRGRDALKGRLNDLLFGGLTSSPLRAQGLWGSLQGSLRGAVWMALQRARP